MRVFMVEDSPIIRQRIEKILAELKEIEIVGETGDAHNATDSILRLKPDAVLLDLELTDGTGYDVLQNLKRAKLHVLVLVLTNFAFPVYREAAFKAGADYFLDKSTEFDKLVPIFQKHVHHTL